MNLPRYEYSTESKAEIFKFVSEGPKGNVQKLVVYSEMAIPNVYNLAFGDYDEGTGFINDQSTTNNKDSEKVLATVSATLYNFIQLHPTASVYATGSTASRTRLYQMGIIKNLEFILRDFEIFGLFNDEWERFEKGKNYEALLARPKNFISL